MDRFTISLPQELNQDFENMREELGITRSDAIRKAMQQFIINEQKKDEEFTGKKIVGTITFLEQSHIHAHPPTLTHAHNQDNPLSPHTHAPEHTYYASSNQVEVIRATEIQHEYMNEIISTTHIHIGPESCMEILAVHGEYEKVKNCLDSLKTLKTIKNIQLNVMQILD